MPDSPVFVTAQLIAFDAAPDRSRLRRAVLATLEEADGLRARFHDSPDGVRFTVGDPLEVEEICTAATDLDALAAVVGLDAPIDPGTGPCARVILIDHSDHPGLLVIAHHIVLDAYGHTMIANRIARLYATPDDPSRLTSVTALPVDTDRPAADDAAFWAQELDAVTGPSTLSGRPRGHRIATRVRTRRVEITPLHDRSGWPMLLTAAIAAFCARSIGNPAVTLGFPMMNRLGSPTANIATTAVNVIPLRVHVPAQSGVGAIAETVTGDVRRLTRHARYRGEQIVRDLRSRGVDGATGPAVNIKPFGASIDLDGITGRIRSLRRGPVVDLSITALHHTDTPDPALELTIDADADLYDDDGLARLADALAAFLTTAVADVDRPVGGIPLDAANAGRAAIAARDAETAGATDPTPLLDWIAAQDPDFVAVVCGDETMTYHVLAQRVDALAATVGTLDRDDIVAILLPRGIDLIVATLAVLRAGAAFLPLDPGFPTRRIEDTLTDADPVAVIESDTDGPRVTRRRESHTSAVSATRRTDDAAYVIYTSGSTGRPKGVVIGHGALRNFTDAMIRLIGLRPGRSMLAVTTASFDISILELVVPLAAGATVVVATAEDVHDPARLARLIDRHRITWMQATPSLWTALLDAGHADALADLDVLVGGEQLPAALATRLAEAARSVRNMYGPTETTIWSTTAPVPAAAPVRIGTPIANTGVRVLDSVLQPVAPGAVGDLYLAGDGLARGYRGRPDLTAGVFVADPFGAPGDRMYRTGDLVRVDELGALDCLGRADHQVKIRGFRVELGDVEAALEAHDTVDHAVAAAVGGRLIGYVTTTAAGAAVDTDGIRAALTRILPEYMVPAAVVVLSGFPLTANGKIDRKALPAPDFAARAGHSRPPRTAAEHALVAVFADILDVGRVGAEDDFFTLGGDSITAVRVVAGAAREGWEITALEVFDHPTPARLAALARQVAIPATAAGTTDVTSESGSGATTLTLDDDEIDDLMDGSLL